MVVFSSFTKYACHCRQRAWLGRSKALRSKGQPRTPEGYELALMKARGVLMMLLKGATNSVQTDHDNTQYTILLLSHVGDIPMHTRLRSTALLIRCDQL